MNFKKTWGPRSSSKAPTMERCKDRATGLTAGPNQSAVCQCLELVRRHGLCPCVRFRGRVRLQWDALRLGAAIDCFPCLRVSSTYLREPFTHAGLSLACTCIAHAACVLFARVCQAITPGVPHTNPPLVPVGPPLPALLCPVCMGVYHLIA